MVEPVRHNTESAMVTAGMGAAKGVVAVMAIPAVVVGGGALLMGFGLGTALITAAVATVGAGVLGAIFGGPLLASTLAIGGLFGLAKGGDRVAKEKQAYLDKVARHENKTGSKLRDAQLAGMQEGYQTGFQEGAQRVVSQLQQMQYQAIQEEMARQHQANQKAPAGGFAAKEAEKRAAQPAAGQQVC